MSHCWWHHSSPVSVLLSLLYSLDFAQSIICTRTSSLPVNNGWIIRTPQTILLTVSVKLWDMTLVCAAVMFWWLVHVTITYVPLPHYMYMDPLHVPLHILHVPITLIGTDLSRFCDCLTTHYCHNFSWPAGMTEELSQLAKKEFTWQGYNILKYPSVQESSQVGIGFLLKDIWKVSVTLTKLQLMITFRIWMTRCILVMKNNMRNSISILVMIPPVRNCTST